MLFKTDSFIELILSNLNIQISQVVYFNFKYTLKVFIQEKPKLPLLYFPDKETTLIYKYFDFIYNKSIFKWRNLYIS